MFAPASFFDFDQYRHAELLAAADHVWDCLKHLKTYIRDAATALPRHEALQDGIPLATTMILHSGELRPARNCTIEYGDATKGKLQVLDNGTELEGAAVLMAGTVLIGSQIQIGEGTLLESGALVKAPAIIGARTEVRQGAYLRGDCVVGDRCVVGHTTEMKHSIFLDDAKAGHFAYIGDSILGGNVNLGAGTKFANLRFLPGTIKVRTPDGFLDTGLRKLGAILGDGAQTGCNSVTNPGTLMGREAVLMPNTTAASGHHSARSVIR